MCPGPDSAPTRARWRRPAEGWRRQQPLCARVRQRGDGLLPRADRYRGADTVRSLGRTTARPGAPRWPRHPAGRRCCGAARAWSALAGRLRPALALRPARRGEDDLEVGLGRHLPRPDGVLLAVPADLGHHPGGQLVLMVLVEPDALV